MASYQDSEQASECLSALNALTAIYRNRDNQSLKSAALAVAFYYKFPTFDSEREGGFSAKRDMSSRSGRLYSGRQGGGRSDPGQARLTTPTTARQPEPRRVRSRLVQLRVAHRTNIANALRKLITSYQVSELETPCEARRIDLAWPLGRSQAQSRGNRET